jgi:uncharacterized protein (TIGR03083 family)
MTSADEQMMWDEVADIGQLLHELDDAQLDAPSLCDGWKVRDVVGHMYLGHTTPMGAMIVRVGRYGFNVTKASRVESQEVFAGKRADDVRRAWDDDMVAKHTRKGIAKVIPVQQSFIDHLIHNQDIRRPTDTPRTVPTERLVRALDVVPSVATPFFAPKKHVAGLRLVATDVEWSHGDGPAVEGPGEAILMAAAGRTAALDDLKGDGVDTLRSRIS